MSACHITILTYYNNVNQCKKGKSIWEKLNQSRWFFLSNRNLWIEIEVVRKLLSWKWSLWIEDRLCNWQAATCGSDRWWRWLAATTSEGLWRLQVHQELDGCLWVHARIKWGDIEIRVNLSSSYWLQTLLRKYCKICWQGTPYEDTVKHEDVGQLEWWLWNKLHWGHFGSMSKEDIQLKRLHVFVHILASVLQRKVFILISIKIWAFQSLFYLPFYKVLISCQILTRLWWAQ